MLFFPFFYGTVRPSLSQSTIPSSTVVYPPPGKGGEEGGTTLLYFLLPFRRSDIVVDGIGGGGGLGIGGGGKKKSEAGARSILGGPWRRYWLRLRLRLSTDGGGVFLGRICQDSATEKRRPHLRLLSSPSFSHSAPTITISGTALVAPQRPIFKQNVNL